MQQVLLNSFFAADSQDIVRHQRPFDKCLASFDDVASVNQEVLSGRHHVLTFNSRFTTNHNRSLTTFFLRQNFDFSVDFGDHGWILWLSCFKDLRDSWQTTGDVRNTTRFTRHLGKHRTRFDLGTVFDHQHRTFRQVLNVQWFARVVFDDDLWVQVTFVVDDQ